MRNKVLKTIRDRELLRDGEHVLLACSGGADSVAMTRLLAASAGVMKLSLTIAHLNHLLRGAESDADEASVRGLADELALPCRVERRDVQRDARRRHLSLEMAAREARYRFFASAAAESEATVVATAHTLDDKAETVIMNLARGTGLAGLGGIPHETQWNGVRVIRPLRDVRRADVVRYLARNDFAWRTDASNQDLCYLRNRVRHVVLPLLEQELNPAAVEAIARTSRVAGDDDAWLTSLTEELMGTCLRAPRADGAGPDLDLGVLCSLPIAARRRVLRMWMAAWDVPIEHVSLQMLERADRLIRGRRGTGIIELVAGWRFERAYGRLHLSRVLADEQALEAFRCRVRRCGTTIIPEADLQVETAVSPGIVRERSRPIGVLPARVSISLSTVGRSALFLRSWRAGDRMRPMGMRGSKKIQDVFSDAKVDRSDRGRVPLLECRGEIVWLAGYCVARGWEVADESSAALQVRVARM